MSLYDITVNGHKHSYRPPWHDQYSHIYKTVAAMKHPPLDCSHHDIYMSLFTNYCFNRHYRFHSCNQMTGNACIFFFYLEDNQNRT